MRYRLVWSFPQQSEHWLVILQQPDQTVANAAITNWLMTEPPRSGFITQFRVLDSTNRIADTNAHPTKSIVP